MNPRYFLGSQGLLCVVMPIYAILVRQGLLAPFFVGFTITLLSCMSYATVIIVSLIKYDERSALYSSILFSIAIKSSVISSVTEGSLSYFGYNEFQRTSVLDVLSRGSFDRVATSKLFGNYADFPLALIQGAAHTLISQADPMVLHSWLGPVIFSLVVLPLLFTFFRRTLLLDARLSILGIVCVNSIYNAHNSLFMGYGTISLILFAMALNCFHRRTRSDAILFVVSVAALAMTHPIPSYALVLFALSYLTYSYAKQSNVGSASVMVALTASLAASWLVFVMSYSIPGIRNVYALLIRNISLPISIPESRYTTFSDPYGELKIPLYAGQIVLMGLTTLGFLALVRKRDKINLAWLLPAELSFAGYTFAVAWGSMKLTDYSLRFIFYMNLLAIVMTSRGFLSVFESADKKLERRRSVALGIILITLVTYSSVAAVPTYVFYRSYPVRSDEPIAYPHQWHSFGMFVRNRSVLPVSVWGAYNAISAQSIAGQDMVNFYIENPSKKTKTALTALSDLNFRLHESHWASPLLSADTLASLSSRSNRVYDTGGVFAYLD